MSKRTSPKSAKSSASRAAVPQEYRKPLADVYTVLLAVALIAIALGTAALWMMMKEDYGYKIKDGPNPAWHRPAMGTSFDVPSYT